MIVVLNHLKSIPIDADLSGMRKSLPQRGGREYLFGQTRSEDGANVEDMNISNFRLKTHNIWYIY